MLVMLLKMAHAQSKNVQLGPSGAIGAPVVLNVMAVIDHVNEHVVEKLVLVSLVTSWSVMFVHVLLGVPGAIGPNAAPAVERVNARNYVNVRAMVSVRVTRMQLNPATRAHVLHGDFGVTGPHALPAVAVDSESVDAHVMEKASVVLVMRSKKVAALWPIVKSMDSGASGALVVEHVLHLTKNQLKLVKENVLFRTSVARLI